MSTIDLSLEHLLVILSAIIMLSGGWTYIADTLKGKTQPNRVTWGMWALAPLIGFMASLDQGADPWALVRTFLAGFLPLLVFISSFFNPTSFWKTSIFEISCGALSLLALIVWLGTEAPRSAILIAVLADLLAAVPTLVKAWKAPETENRTVFVASLTSAVLVIPSIPNWRLENCAFTIYLLIINITLILMLSDRRVARKHSPLA